jgi:hypothetical protein
MRVATMNHLEKLRRSPMSIAANAPSTFLKLRRSGMFVRRLMESESRPHSLADRQLRFNHDALFSILEALECMDFRKKFCRKCTILYK